MMKKIDRKNDILNSEVIGQRHIKTNNEKFSFVRAEKEINMLEFGILKRMTLKWKFKGHFLFWT